jgi:hypothetical protein
VKKFITGQWRGPATPQKERPPGRIRKTFHSVKHHPLWWLVGGGFSLFLALSAALEAVAFYNGGPPWPTMPDIEAQNPINGSSDILPFVIANRSGLFPIKKANLSCYVDLAFVMDAKRQTILLRDVTYSEGATPVPGQTNYYCDNKILSIVPDGSLIIGFPGKRLLHTKPGLYFAPLVTLKLCVMISGTYKTRLGISSFHSAMFQWPVDPLDHQWIKGPIAFDFDDSQWIPPDSTMAGVYTLRQSTTRAPNGTLTYLPGALQCDPASQ